MMTPFKNEAEYYGFDPRECATAIADLFNALDQRYGTSNAPLTAEDVALSTSINRKYRDDANGVFSTPKPELDVKFDFKRVTYEFQSKYPGETPYYSNTHLVGSIKKIREVMEDKGWNKEASLCNQLYDMLKKRDPDRLYGYDERDRDR